MTGRQPTLFHRGACECREPDDVASCIDVRDVSLEELIHFQLATRIRRQSSSFQVKLIAIGLAAHSIDEGVALYHLVAPQLHKTTSPHRVAPDACRLLPQP